ncbi:MAG: hydroxyacid dehydrogenase [Deltaproteobacteria bacterium]|jgi:D-3-phosphoglycerate dehydrogenase|nr:hydroxyacid dehydrogenase [Deltaproteobacteria bacterium]
MMNVHVTEPIHERAMAILREHATVIDWENPSVRDFADADAVIVRAAKVDRPMLEKSPRLKVIGKHGVGLDAIDVAAARELGKIVTFTPQANMEGVAELAVAFMLTMARNIPWGHRQLQAGAYRAVAPGELTGVELKDKSLGLVGIGRIGRRVGEILRNGFAMTCIGFDPFLPDAEFARLDIERAADMKTLLPRADYISISVPLTPETTNLIDAGELALCKPNAILVNTARGGIVNEKALCEALRAKTLRAAACDVFVDEPIGKDHPLLSLPNFVAMPHIGASTEESLIRMGETVAADVLRVLRGEKPLYPVTAA